MSLSSIKVNCYKHYNNYSIDFSLFSCRGLILFGYILLGFPDLLDLKCPFVKMILLGHSCSCLLSEISCQLPPACVKTVNP